MVRSWSGLLALVLSSQLVACGDDGGVAQPRSVSENGSSDPGADPGDVGAELGTCKKLCCSDADCGAGLTCTAFGTSGSLGVCAAGSDTTTSADPPAGASLSESCWSAGDAKCNALTSEGCSAGDACDYAAGEADVDPVVSCFGGDNVQAEGESCDNALGPWCQPGWHCVTE
jgi:hypothetical protein